MEDINLHFTGDFHAIASAHNLLSAMLDAHLHHGNALGLDTRRITWPRTIDMNDRALRNVIVGLGGLNAGPAREERFVIIPGSEIMAIMALATGIEDLEQRLARIIVGLTSDKHPVRASDLKAQGAMTLLLKDAINPNLVQTLEGGPAFIHCGPFGNIAHGCNSVVATRLALTLCDVVLTEAGFGADLGAEKFFDIKCRMAGLNPEAAIVVATVRALKMHGGVKKDALGKSDVDAVRRGGAGARAAACDGAGRDAGVHGEDAILVLGRSGEAGGAERVHAPGPRHSAFGRRGVRCGPRGRHHDYAGPLQDARGRTDPGAPGRHDRGTFLMAHKALGIVVTQRAPKAIGPYSQAVVVDGMVYTAGQIPLDPETGAIVGQTTPEQVEQVLKNLGAILKAAGSGLDLVVKTTVYLVDLADFPAMNEVYARYFPTHKPARSTVQAAALPRAVRVEIDAIARVG